MDNNFDINVLKQKVFACNYASAFKKIQKCICYYSTSLILKNMSLTYLFSFDGIIAQKKCDILHKFFAKKLGYKKTRKNVNQNGTQCQIQIQNLMTENIMGIG